MWSCYTRQPTPQTPRAPHHNLHKSLLRHPHKSTACWVFTLLWPPPSCILTKFIGKKSYCYYKYDWNCLALWHMILVKQQYLFCFITHFLLLDQTMTRSLLLHVTRPSWAPQASRRSSFTKKCMPCILTAYNLRTLIRCLNWPVLGFWNIKLCYCCLSYKQAAKCK
jgi:hypothetical protein